MYFLTLYSYITLTIFISCFCTLVFSVTLFQSNATTTLYLETVVTILTVLTTNGSQKNNQEKELSQVLTAVQSQYSYLGLICIFQYCQSGKTRHCCLCGFIVMILETRKADLFSQRVASNSVCLSSKLKPMVYAPSHTQSGYTYNCRVIVANR